MKYSKRNKQGMFRKNRKLIRKIKIALFLYLAYAYAHPALEVIWTHQAQPYLAQLLK